MDENGGMNNEENGEHSIYPAIAAGVILVVFGVLIFFVFRGQKPRLVRPMHGNEKFQEKDAKDKNPLGFLIQGPEAQKTQRHKLQGILQDAAKTPRTIGPQDGNGVDKFIKAIQEHGVRQKAAKPSRFEEGRIMKPKALGPGIVKPKVINRDALIDKPEFQKPGVKKSPDATVESDA